MGLSSVLPFLAALQKQQGISPSTFQQGADAPAALSGGPVDMSGPDPRNFDVGSGTSAPPAGPIAQQPVSQLPDVGTGEPQAAPEDKGSFLRQPYETKGHALLQLLRNGLVGGLSGMAANAATYGATGRNAGFGGGAAAGYLQSLPMQAAFQQLGLQKAGLENQQLIQMLPFLRAQQFANLGKVQAETQNLTAQAGKATAEAGAVPIETALKQAQTEAAYYKEDPNLGLIDLRTKQPVDPSALAPLTSDEAKVLGKQPGDRVPLKLKNTANEIAVRGLTTVNTEEGVYERNRQTGGMTRLGNNPRMVFAPENQITAAAGDPNNPGQLTFMTKGQAMATGAQAPGSAPVTEAKAEARSEVPKNIGDQRVAFNTMIAHAQLLRQAAAALNNGDVQALNGLKNSFKNQFGYSGPITAEAIADAYKGEVTNVIDKGHITDKGNERVAHTLDPLHQNYQTVDSVLGAYQGLAQSKLNMLNQQANIAKGQPAPQTQFTVTDPAGGIHTFKDQKSADGFKAAIGVK